MAYWISGHAAPAPDLSRRIGRYMEAWARYRLYRRTLAELRRLDERNLDDIGISPGDIEDTARRSVTGLV